MAFQPALVVVFLLALVAVVVYNPAVLVSAADVVVVVYALGVAAVVFCLELR